MKILTLHSDYITFEPKKKALKNAEEVEAKPKTVKECLVVLTAVEKRDEANAEAIVKRLAKEVSDIAGQVKTENIVLYPYAHLSSNLALPDKAAQIMKDAEKELSKKFKVTRAPFGWYKSFEVKCKGHPLSELSREFGAEGKEEAKEEELSKEARESLLKTMSKTKMSAERSKEGLKSNVELGRELDLYTVNEIIGSGLPLLTPKGATIRRELERFIVDEELKRGYGYTVTPIMAKSDLYKISGHWQHYKEFMFSLNVGNEVFALRPMTCPFQFVIYKSKIRSYKDLPIRYAEISNLFRNEKSGELMGLTRLRQFTLADAHIICRPDQLEDEFEKVIDLVKYVMKTLDIKDIWYRFSKWDPKNKEKYIDNPKAWETSQKSMKKILDKLKMKYVEAENEAAFYGPKLDIQYKNIFGKEDTLITVQIDFALPEKFDLTYVGEDSKSCRPIVIHRSSIGCLERTMAYILEKTQGSLPLWLSPVQVKVITINDRNIPFAKDVFSKLKEKGIRAELNEDAETISKKVRDAQLEKANYIVTIGDKEVEKKKLAVRTRAGEVKFDVDVDDFVKSLINEIEKRD